MLKIVYCTILIFDQNFACYNCYPISLHQNVQGETGNYFQHWPGSGRGNFGGCGVISVKWSAASINHNPSRNTKLIRPISDTMGSCSKEHRWSKFEWNLEKLANVRSNIFFNWTKAESTFWKLKSSYVTKGFGYQIVIKPSYFWQKSLFF